MKTYLLDEEGYDWNVYYDSEFESEEDRLLIFERKGKAVFRVRVLKENPVMRLTTANLIWLLKLFKDIENKEV